MSQKLAEKYNCATCDYTCFKKHDMSKHETTRKHQNRTNRTQIVAESKLICGNCSKEYSARSSLWYHERKCKTERQIEKSIEHEKSPYLEIINKLLSDNMELKNFIIEQSKATTDTMSKVIEYNNDTMNKVIEQNTDIMNKVIETSKPSNNTIHGNVNNNTQKFNINVFLNEECKNAMNFSDFIKNLTVSREDLENNAQLGFVNGVSKILIESLKQLSKTERPIHCTDIKRETIYIKDDNKWTKEDHTKINSAIQEVTRKSLGTLMNWKDENPDYKDRDSVFSERCIVIQQQSMAAHNRDTYYPQVVKAIAKEVTI